MEENKEDDCFKDANGSVFSSLTDAMLSMDPTPCTSVDSSKDFSTLNISEDVEYDLELQDISEDSDSDYSLDGESEEEEFSGQSHHESTRRLPVESDVADVNNCGVLVPLDDDNGDDIDSEEERDLLKDIKEEIQDMVREEMKDELNVYKVKLAAMEKGHFEGPINHDRDAEDGLEDLDPKLREAYIKMNKLDRILAKKLKREKEVKRDRILLEKQIREEIAALKHEGRIQKDIQFNTDKFVSLALPPSHNEGVEVDTRPVSPVFQTQLNEQHFSEAKQNDKDSDGPEASRSTSKVSNSTDGTEREKEKGKKRHRKKKKNFIKRNKELAANSESIAMTEDEKQRVGDLLADLDALAECPEEEIAVGQEEPASQLISVNPGDGYNPDIIEKDSLTYIDNRLRVLLPEDEYQSLVTVTPKMLDQHKCFTRVDVMSFIDNDRYGERALLETKEERDMQFRLKAIEEELLYFHNPEESELDSSFLSKTDLNSLLDQCVRSLSRTSCGDSTVDNNLTSRSDGSIKSLIENPPHLPDDVLQKLLAEAHFPLSARLGDLDEDDESSEVEGGENKPISAETWKTIVEQDETLDPIETAEEMYTRSLSRPSRNSSRSSSLFGRPLSNQSYHNNDTINDEDDRLILPEISSSPYLVAQGLNNQVTKNEYHSKRNSQMTSGRNSIDIVRNNLTDGDFDTVSFTSSVFSFDDDTPVPRPPIGQNGLSFDSDVPGSRPLTGFSGFSFDSDMAMPRPPTSERRPTPGQTLKSSRSIVSSASSPTMRVSSPTVRVSSPTVRVSSPAVRVSSPTVRVSSPAMRVSSPTVRTPDQLSS